MTESTFQHKKESTRSIQVKDTRFRRDEVSLNHKINSVILSSNSVM